MKTKQAVNLQGAPHGSGMVARMNSTRVFVHKNKNKASAEPLGGAAWVWGGCAPEFHPRGCS